MPSLINEKIGGVKICARNCLRANFSNLKKKVLRMKPFPKKSTPKLVKISKIEDRVSHKSEVENAKEIDLCSAILFTSSPVCKK